MINFLRSLVRRLITFGISVEPKKKNPHIGGTLANFLEPAVDVGRAPNGAILSPDTFNVEITPASNGYVLSLRWHEHHSGGGYVIRVCTEESQLHAELAALLVEFKLKG